MIVAVVGAGLDLAAAGSALKAMRTAVTTFNEAGAAGALVRLEKDLKGLAEVSDQLRANTMKAAAAELHYRKALTGLLASTAGSTRSLFRRSKRSADWLEWRPTWPSAGSLPSTSSCWS